MNSLVLNNGICLQERKDAVRNVANVKKTFTMLQNNLYVIVEKSDNRNRAFTYTINFKPECEIYRVHFPDHPITPGACLIEIAKELMEDYLGRELILRVASNVKFLIPINPNIHRISDFVFTIKDKKEPEIEGKLWDVDIHIKHDVELFAKMSLSFEI